MGMKDISNIKHYKALYGYIIIHSIVPHSTVNFSNISSNKRAENVQTDTLIARQIRNGVRSKPQYIVFISPVYR